jgi:phage shock protein PspC (stress-responsive transcriptional regulator)
MNCPFYLAAIGLGIGIGIARNDLILIVLALFVIGLAAYWALALVWPKKTVWRRPQEVVVIRR